MANLTNCSENEIAAIEFALRPQANLTELGSVNDSKITEGGLGDLFVCKVKRRREEMLWNGYPSGGRLSPELSE